MQVTFVKTDGAHDRLYILRDDEAERSFRLVRHPGAPHDLVHYVVESTVGLSRGFWGLIAAGAEFEVANQVGTQMAKRSLAGRDLTQLLQAEALVRAAEHLRPRSAVDAPSYLAALQDGCRQGGVPAPSGLDNGTVARVCEAVGHADARWLGLLPGQCITLRWPQPLT